MTTRFAFIAAIALCSTLWATPWAMGASAQAPGASPFAPAISLPAPPPPNTPGGDEARFKELLATPFYDGLLRHALDGVPPAVYERCPNMVSNSSEITIFRALQYSANGAPIAGAWKQSLVASGCGPDTTLNFFFVVTKELKINTIIGVVGSTHAEPNTQFNARRLAIDGAAAALQLQGGTPCGSYIVKNTRFEGYGLENPSIPDPGPSVRLRPWREKWTVGGCGRAFLVPLNFIPGAGGGPVEITRAGAVTQAPLYDVNGPPPSPYGPQADAPAAAPPAAPAAAKP